jgi:hypothetical protein
VDTPENKKFVDRFERKNLCLDLVGLTAEEREEGSILLGGSAKEFITLDDEYNFGQIDSVVFRWGDKTAIAAFARLLEHDDRALFEQKEYFPFSATTLIGDEIWVLAVQEREFDPSLMLNAGAAIELPFDEDEGLKAMERFLSRPTPREELIARIGQRWVAFEMGMKIR